MFCKFVQRYALMGNVCVSMMCNKETIEVSYLHGLFLKQWTHLSCKARNLFCVCHDVESCFGMLGRTGICSIL